MKPPYTITPVIVELIASVSEKIGEVNANYLDKQSPTLRKQNKIKTIQSSLQIEGNTLSEEQITALIENKRVIGPEKDVLEVLNAIQVYEDLFQFDPLSEPSFLKAHKILMSGLIAGAGSYRKKGVGIVHGSQVAHVAPPAENVPFLMKDLFDYLRSDEIPLIQSCVFHYEMEFIHPFADGNGRMGRLWQTMILVQKYAVFEFLPFETLISETQSHYYKALSLSDKAGNSTPFIEYMLTIIDRSLSNLLSFNNRSFTQSDRIAYFIKSSGKKFSRKDYMKVFKDISTATATRDLRKAEELNLVKRQGELNKTIYIVL
ncbi:MAG: Fic family protein [Bacteroidota bacterium]